ncbi:MAG TPA: helix-turn-helix transcriptional regulator [Thermomicrobiaceae bacterium]|nr:helix-turn-helix transcriptional regulator [Thermomicrobiaceae bacterium]
MASSEDTATPPNETRQRIGPAIRTLRQEHHLSLSDLAQQTGISVSYLSRLEKGKSVPSFTLLYRLAQVLGVDIGFFVETEKTATEIDQRLEQALGRTSLPRAIWPELFNLSLAAREALLEFLEQLNPPVSGGENGTSGKAQANRSGSRNRRAEPQED